eukprot:11810195-Ditylum_brightwellii.AAC.1
MRYKKCNKLLFLLCTNLKDTFEEEKQDNNHNGKQEILEEEMMESQCIELEDQEDHVPEEETMEEGTEKAKEKEDASF